MRDIGLLDHSAESATLPALGATDGECAGRDDGGDYDVCEDHFYLWLGAEDPGTSIPAPLRGAGEAESGFLDGEKAGDVDAKLRALEGAKDVVHGGVVEVDASIVPVCAKLVESCRKISECTDECGADDLAVLDRRADR